MSASPSKTVRELAVENPGSIRVFEKLGIDYCCGGGKSLQDVCAGANISVADLLARIAESAQRFPVSDGTDWSARSLGELISHIVDRHHAYVREEIPRLQQMARKLAGVHKANHPELQLVEKLFALLAAELGPHLLKEEQVLFPYLRQMEAALAAGQPLPPAFFGSVNNPVRAMVTDHDGAGELLRQLRKVSGEYELPEDACATFRAFYEGLQEFERDLHQHIHLENNLLFPRAVMLEMSATEQEPASGRY